MEDFSDGEQEGGAILGDGDGERLAVGAAGVQLVGVGDLAGGMVEVTKIFRAECGTAATVSGGEDVAALEALDFDGFEVWFVFHGGTPSPGVSLAKSSRITT